MKAMNREELQLHGSWTHSHEEDEPGIRVYRPTHTFAFPPARGRETLDFGDSGRLTVNAPGPDDRSRSRTGTWTELGMKRIRLGGEAMASGKVIEIITFTRDILKIRDV